MSSRGSVPWRESSWLSRTLSTENSARNPSPKTNIGGLRCVVAVDRPDQRSAGSRRLSATDRRSRMSDANNTLQISHHQPFCLTNRYLMPSSNRISENDARILEVLQREGR